MFSVSRAIFLKELCKSEVAILCTQFINNDKSKRPGVNFSRRISSYVMEQSKKANDMKCVMATVKPPNILVHHGDSDKQRNLRQLVTSVVGVDNYTVYDLPLSASSAWLDSATLLVLCGELSTAVSDDVERFLQDGGHVVSLGSSLTLGVLDPLPAPPPSPLPTSRHTLVTYGTHMDVPCEYSAVVRRLLTPSVVKNSSVTVLVSGVDKVPVVLLWSATKCGSALLTQLDWSLTSPSQMALLRDLLRHELDVRCTDSTYAGAAVNYRPGYITGDQASVLRLALQPPSRAIFASTGTPVLELATNSTTLSASAELLPLQHTPPPCSQFNSTLYFEHLRSPTLGRCLVYAPAVTSSLDVLRDPRLAHGTAVVCDTQTRGRGRAGNTWISPPGCCMLAVLLQVTLGSPLWGRLSWLQHVAALAVADTVSDDRLGLKWPNDLYWDSCIKLGGVLVETSVCGSSATCRLGIGVNLDNAAPTVCLNSMLDEPLSRERLVAGVLTRLEELLDMNVDVIKGRYMDRWLHKDQKVTVWRKGEDVVATVVGLDQYGFLLVKVQATGEEVTVSPDGNSFDMMRGLILPKE